MEAVRANGRVISTQPRERRISPILSVDSAQRFRDPQAGAQAPAEP